MSTIKRQLFFKDLRIHDINQSNALNAVHRYLEEQKLSFLTTLSARKDANKTAVTSAIDNTINTWKTDFNTKLTDTIKPNMISYLTSANGEYTSLANDADVGTSSWTEYNDLITNYENTLFDLLDGTIASDPETISENVFKAFNETLDSYASKTVVDALDEFAKVMDSAFVFGEDYPGYITDVKQSISFVDYSDVAYLNSHSTSGQTGVAVLTSTEDVFFSDEANVYYKYVSPSGFYRLYKDGEVVRAYQKDLNFLNGSVYYTNDNVQFKYKQSETSFTAINHGLSWPIPTANTASLPTGSTKVYLSGNNEPTVVYYSPSLTNYAVLVSGQYKRLFYNNAVSGEGNADVLITSTSSETRKNFYEVISGVFDSTGTGTNANLYNVSFYKSEDNLTYLDATEVKDWSAIYKGKVRYAKETDTIRTQTIDGVKKYYIKTTTDVPTAVTSGGVTTIQNVSSTFVCLLMDDSTYRPIIQPSLTKTEVVGTLAVYYDQQNAMTESAFDALALVN
jgi:hypothetical protein